VEDLNGQKVHEIGSSGIKSNGVQFVFRADNFVVYAKREAFLGAIFTPWLYSLSGLGPKAVL
jgi:hypothetical protein